MIKNIVTAVASGAVGLVFLGMIGACMIRETIIEKESGLGSFND